jgi:hypothetical protein
MVDFQQSGDRQAKSEHMVRPVGADGIFIKLRLTDFVKSTKLVLGRNSQ